MPEEIIEEIEAEENSPEDIKTDNESAEDDYEAIIEEDLEVLRKSIPDLAAISDISELENPVRYGALRDLGLTPEEAYRATTTRIRVTKSDNRSHLRSSAPKPASSPVSSMSYRDMEAARQIFSGISDAEIQRLYKKVTR